MTNSVVIAFPLNDLARWRETTRDARAKVSDEDMQRAVAELDALEPVKSQPGKDKPRR